MNEPFHPYLQPLPTLRSFLKSPLQIYGYWKKLISTAGNLSRMAEAGCV
ncbi:MAG: hypothetical protein NWE78_03595 [Candidatus Bathyarchaeota archaeon]|nr:hypothetical protein [Candidatus Bathyarchaeota archaeon]